MATPARIHFEARRSVAERLTGVAGAVARRVSSVSSRVSEVSDVLAAEALGHPADDAEPVSTLIERISTGLKSKAGANDEGDAAPSAPPPALPPNTTWQRGAFWTGDAKKDPRPRCCVFEPACLTTPPHTP